MKLTKSQLNQIIQEELEQITEFNIPFIGKKMSSKDYKALKDKYSNLRKRFIGTTGPGSDAPATPYDVAHFEGPEAEEALVKLREAGDQALNAVRNLTRSRHTTKQSAPILQALEGVMSTMESSVQNAAKTWAYMESESEKRRLAAQEIAKWEKHWQQVRTALAQAPSDVPSGDRGAPHRAHPGIAGTANLAYGEGIERAELEKIIREELEGILK